LFFYDNYYLLRPLIHFVKTLAERHPSFPPWREWRGGGGEVRKSILFIIVSLFVLPITAHEFWLQPEKFMYQPGDNINVRFWVGEDFNGENWNGNHAKVNKLQLYIDDISDDMADQVSDETGDSLQLSIFDEGTAMIAFNSNNSFIKLDSAKFNAYLKDDGLSNTIDYRAAHNENDSCGKEFYQRSVKTLIQVGDKKTDVCRPANLPLDIIPAVNPYSLNNKDSLTVKLLFNKQPLTNQLVNVWQRQNNITTRQQYTSNDKAEISFVVLTTGKWMVSTVRMIHIENDAQANWQSYWGSCTWGYQ
jgi:uncharacterized GH25 family protein